ncbi:ARM repeat-containing protein [Coprinopsis marcescibilis]|uniref:ARM repeat-containing protein n=1 Tax=Coprinopsis marcescibilis TaxID=230819 RepID=A0A5C3KIU5_COPMA|nr:ARM repeat-containing protein [Coprinopsis marcescibilis]
MLMEAVVPPEITAELTQILSNLVLGDNEIRSNAEKAVNDRLAHTPELYILALTQFAIAADTEVMRSFSLVLLRRLLFRPPPTSSQAPQRPNDSRLVLYDHLSANTITTLERLLLHSLSAETSPSVRRKSVDTICDVAKQGMARGRPWHALQAQSFTMTQVPGNETGAGGAGLRESAYRVFAGCPNLVMDLQTDAVLSVFQKGLQDNDSIEVRHAALLASVAYLSSADQRQLSQSLSLLYPILDTVHSLSQSLSQPPIGAASSTNPKSNCHHLSTFLAALTPLCSTHPSLFAPHLNALLSFLPSLILPAVDSGPTPTVGRPFPVGNGGKGGSAFVFPPADSISESSGNDENAEDDGGSEEDDERASLRLAALEFMVSLSEAKPGMVKKVNGWVEIIVRACLEGMGEFDEDESVDVWLKEDPSAASDAESIPAIYEQSLDRLACALGGRAVLPPAFNYIPAMLANYDWRSRHAGLMAIAAIGEGTGKVMQNELGKIVELVVPMFQDSHPRVRFAACQCVGQLCTDLEEILQEKYNQQLFPMLVQALEDPEPRVHAHAASALINFCEGVERESLLPYLDPIVARLLKLLNPGGDQTNTRKYVQEQAVTTLAMVADASEATFAKHYPTIMPLLLAVLRNADGMEYGKLRIKAMECAGLIAIAVGKDIFRPDSSSLIESLMRIQNSPRDPNDTQVMHYLISTWAKVCQALGPEFEPYLPVVMPSLLTTASAKADINVYDEDVENMEEKEGWEVIEMDGQTLGIRTSSIEEKCQAFETLVIYCSTLGAHFAPYLSQTLEITLPALKFYFHDGVREACAMLVPMLLACGKQSGTVTAPMVSATLHQLIDCINSEYDSSFLASLFKCFCDCTLVIGGPGALLPEFHRAVIEATKRQLQSIADKRKTRSTRAQAEGTEPDEREDMALLEEIEDFALEEIGNMLKMFDRGHPLLIAVSSVKDLGFNTWESDEDGGEIG